MTDIAALYQSLSEDHRRLLAARLGAGSAQGASRNCLVAFVTDRSGEGGVDTQALRSWLDARVPDHMVPDIVELLREMPRLPNGKIDRRNLATRPLQGAEKGLVPEATPTAPLSQVEETLAGIWSELLGVHPIRRDDNFFELGGDSIVAIQFLSRARQAGVQLEPSDIAEHQTIAALAHADRQQDASDPAEASATAPLLPAQHRYWMNEISAFGDNAVARRFYLDTRLTPDHLNRALAACADAHPALRTRFEQIGEGWRQISDLPAPELVMACAEGGTPPDLQALEEAARARLAPVGPLAQVVHIETGTRQNQLLLLLHPLIADAASWEVLIADLEAAAADLIAGRRPRVAVAPSPLQIAKALEAYAETAQLNSDLACWADQPDPGAFVPPLEATAKAGPPGRSEVSRDLDPTLCQQILSEANRAYNTDPIEVILSAVTLAATQRTRQPDIVIALESDGRELPLPDMEVGRTIGAVSTSFPAYFKAAAGGDPSATLKNVKEAHRRFRKKALSHAIARHLASSGADHACWPRPGLGFSIHDMRPARTAQLLLSPVETVASFDPQPLHDLDLRAIISDGGLRLSLLHDPACYGAEAAGAFLAEVVPALEKIVAHCLARSEGGFTPSDFPEADLDQDELDDFLNALEADDG